MSDKTNEPLTTQSEHDIRVQKIKQLRARSLEPWPELTKTNTTAHEIVSSYAPEKEQTVYTVAGRLIALRAHGKTVFAHLIDRTGKVQMYLKKDTLGDDRFDTFVHLIDIGDIVWFSGTPFKTKTGEVTLNVTDYKLLSKCLHPLPEKFHGLADVEIRYRQRYLDLISNPDSREKFKRRSTLIQSLRDYLNNHDFLEVETPMLHPIPGGATARPFITHHNTYHTDLYLRIAPELYLKRLVVGGFERVYEINRNFRNEGVSTKHNPEFTMLEFYMAYQDYVFIMQFVEELLRTTALKTTGSLQLPYGEQVIDFEKPFTRISVYDSVISVAGIQEKELAPDTINKTLTQYDISYESSTSFNAKIFALFEKLVEPKLIQPTFIIDFPIEISPLARRDANNPDIAARFELFIAGMELSNSFNELNDPFDQADRFHKQLEKLTRGDQEAHHFDKDYIQALEYGLPPTVGVGIGIDRLTMLLTNTQSIKDVILFPTLKKQSE